ncbi:hypothetical protein EJ110_NYTH01818 [Nymphaea thermarum]|nr:hypothetical protein EJ110_NYTH01818 [Nymphaea thermarum]
MAPSTVFPLKLPLYCIDSALEVLAKGRICRIFHHVQYAIALFLYALFSALRLLLLRFPAASRRIPNPEAAGSDSPAVLDSGIGRALTQILSLTSEIPVGSRKYDVVRDLADRIIDENARDGSAVLAEINRAVVSSAFGRTLDFLEVAMEERSSETEFPSPEKVQGSQVIGLLRVVEAARRRLGFSGRRDRSLSAEKLALELLWLAQKLDVCGAVGDAIRRLGSASRVARLAVSADPRLQSCIVKLSVFILKKIKEVEEDGDNKIERSEVLQFLLCWMPLLCHASNGADAPVLSSVERVHMEGVIEETINRLALEDQEEVLRIWLKQYSSSTSDWPNLQQCYNRWYSASRKLVG